MMREIAKRKKIKTTDKDIRRYTRKFMEMADENDNGQVTKL